MKTKHTRIKVKKSMIDLGFDRPGSLPILAEAIDANVRSLSMALTGYRKGKRSVEILEKLQAHLKNDQAN